MMMMHREKGKGTLIIDRVFKGIGRIKRASGVDDPRTFRRMIERFQQLTEDDRGRELVRSMKAGKISPLDLFEIARHGDFSKLPSADSMLPLSEPWKAWVARTEYSPDHKRNLLKELKRFEAHRKDVAAKDLPTVVTELRITMAGKARSFNYARAAALAYLRQSVKRSSPLYIDVRAIDPLKVTPKRVPPRLTILDVESYGREGKDLALTGMLPKEYWGRVHSVQGKALRIKGTKRAGRDRRVPLVEPIEGPKISRMSFRRVVRKIGQYAVQPKDFRNFYAWLLEESEIPRTRRRMYMGHGKKDTTDIYEERDIREFIPLDAEAIRSTLKRLRRQAKKEQKQAVGQSPTVSPTVRVLPKVTLKRLK